MSGKEKRKTKTVVKRRLNIKRVFLLVVLFSLAFMLIKEVFKLEIDTILVSGNDYLSASDIIDVSGLKIENSFLKVSKREVCKNIKTLSLVDSCTLKKSLDRKVKIIITENKPLFYYLNEEKVVLSSMDAVELENTFGIPTLINYVPEKVLDEFTSGLSHISGDIIRSISEIEYTPSTNSKGAYIDEERFMLSMNDGNIIYINNKHLDILESYDKIYAHVSLKTGGKKGTYNFDSDFDNYIFKAFE